LVAIMSEPPTWTDGLPSIFVSRQGAEQPGGDDSAGRRRRRWGVRLWRFTRWFMLTGIVLAVALTAARFGYNFSTDGPAARPPGLLMAHGGGFDTRYREWGT
jgi:hypothetical protein